MENRFKIEKIENNKTYYSLYINDTKKHYKFWVDCSYTEEAGLSWEFNQYIFNTTNEQDLEAQAYQNDWENNGDSLFYFLDYNDQLNDINKITLVNDILICYTNDEAGESEKNKYLQMTDDQKIKLYDNSKEMNKDPEDFSTDLVINFNYNNY